MNGLKYSSPYLNDPTFSTRIELNGKVAFEPKSKFNKTTALVNFQNEALKDLLIHNGIKVNENEKYGYSCFVNIGDKKLKKGDEIKGWIYIKKFINNSGKEFNSVCLWQDG